jgi:hypothetical protein
MSKSRRVGAGRMPVSRSGTAEIRAAIDRIEARKLSVRKTKAAAVVATAPEAKKPKRQSRKSKAARNDIYARQTRLSGSYEGGKKRR